MGVGVLAMVFMAVEVGVLATMVQIAEVRERRSAVAARTAIVRGIDAS